MLRDWHMRAEHAAVWSAIDALAAQTGRTPCALAVVAGLDATTFKRSARIGETGLPRWPSVGTIARVLRATGTSFEAFGAYVDELTKGYVAPPEVRPVLERRVPKVAA